MSPATADNTDKPGDTEAGEARRIHLQRTQAEFALQVGPMSQGDTFNAVDAVEPFVSLLGAPLRSPVLDLACGPGIVSAALARAGVQVVGVDATAAMIDAARERCRELPNTRFQQADAHCLDFANASFAAAVTRLSVHHFTEPATVLCELRRVLCGGARFVLGDIVSSSVLEEARLHDAIETLRDPSHVRFQNEGELCQLVLDAGFRIDRIHSWENRKGFDEWAAIVGAARSMEPVREVMLALARAGLRMGIDLRAEDGQIDFVHHWRFLQMTAV